jgi:hypothetical protein
MKLIEILKRFFKQSNVFVYSHRLSREYHDFVCTFRSLKEVKKFMDDRHVEDIRFGFQPSVKVFRIVSINDHGLKVVLRVELISDPLLPHDRINNYLTWLFIELNGNNELIIGNFYDRYNKRA